jgi:hypothetical protein
MSRRPAIAGRQRVRHRFNPSRERFCAIMGRRGARRLRYIGRAHLSCRMSAVTPNKAAYLTPKNAALARSSAQAAAGTRSPAVPNAPACYCSPANFDAGRHNLRYKPPLRSVMIRREGPNPEVDRRCNLHHSTLMPASLRIGHHRSISAFWKARSACGVCCSRAKISFPSSASRWLTFASPDASTTAALSLAITSCGVPLGAQNACQNEA